MLNHHLEPIYRIYLMEKDITKESRKLYGIALKQYIQFLIDHQILHARTGDILTYKETLKDHGYMTNWIYVKLNVIQGFYRYLRANRNRFSLPEIYAYDVTENVKNVQPKPSFHKRMLTLEQAKHLILHTKENRKYIWHYRDHALLFLMITTGLRSIEVRRARKHDFLLKGDQWMLYIQGKGKVDSDDYVKVTPAVSEAIQDYLRRRKDSNPYLFISHSKRSKSPALSRSFFPNMFPRVLKECGIEHSGLTPHALRHAAATFNLLRGGSLESTRKLLRHANINTTLVYAHHINRMQDDSESQIEKYILKEEPTEYDDRFVIVLD
jgi:integrase/recombinase XerD